MVPGAEAAMSLGERAELRGTVIEGKYRLGERIGIGGTGVTCPVGLFAKS